MLTIREPRIIEREPYFVFGSYCTFQGDDEGPGWTGAEQEFNRRWGEVTHIKGDLTLASCTGRTRIVPRYRMTCTPASPQMRPMPEDRSTASTSTCSLRKARRAERVEETPTSFSMEHCMEYLLQSDALTGYRVKVMHRGPFPVLRYWHDAMADRRLVKLIAASTVRPLMWGLGSWIPECRLLGQRTII